MSNKFLGTFGQCEKLILRGKKPAFNEYNFNSSRDGKDEEN
jgi:hypothetical protein